MVDSGSWSKYPPIVTTPGQSEPIPYHYLPGSALGTTDSPEIGDAVDELFPFANGVSDKLVRFDFADATFKDVAFPTVNGVAGLTIAPASLDPSAFLSWHSSHQLRYIDAKGTGSPKSIELTDPASGDKLHAIASADGNRVIILEQLGKTDIGRMSLADQQRVASLSQFTQAGGLATRLGLIPAAGATVSVRNADGTSFTVVPATTVAEAAAAIDLYLQREIAYYLKDTFVGEFHTSGAAQVFRDQVENLRTRAASSAVFSLKDLQDAVQKIETRYDRARLFGEVWPETQRIETVNGVFFANAAEWMGVISLDGTATIKSGFANFMKQERQILAIDNHRLLISQTGTLQDKKLDVPNLIFLLQLDYNLSTEAKVVADTEEINQQNALLQTYGRMQQAINNVSKQFGTDQNERRTITGSTSDNEFVANLSVEQQKLFSMFEDLNYNFQKHPIEQLRGISRPFAEIFINGNYIDGQFNKNARLRKTQWDSFNTQLSDTVTLINQENQIKMNDINSMNKQKDRHFDLANGALSKMFDTIQNIARAVGN